MPLSSIESSVPERRALPAVGATEKVMGAVVGWCEVSAPARSVTEIVSLASMSYAADAGTWFGRGFGFGFGLGFGRG
jgi:hypothetical protein